MNELDDLLEEVLPSLSSQAEVWREDGVYVSRWPRLGVYSQGDTEQEAREHLAEAVELFIQSCHERGTLDAVMGRTVEDHNS